MEGKLTVFLKCKLCDELFANEAKFFEHCREDHCEEVVVFEHCNVSENDILPSVDAEQSKNSYDTGHSDHLFERDESSKAEAALVVSSSESGSTKPEPKDVVSNSTVTVAVCSDNMTSFGVFDSLVEMGESSSLDYATYVVVPAATKCDDKVARESAYQISENFDADVVSHNIVDLTELNILPDVNGQLPAHDSPNDNGMQTIESSEKAKEQRKLRMDKAGGICNICNKYYNWLNDHMTYRHSSDRPFVCEVCGYPFKKKGDLVMHLRVHTGEAPYPCDICGKKFKQSGMRGIHRLTHFSDRPYHCSTCGKSFQTNKALSRHMMIHTTDKDYRCEICSMTFKLRSYLKGHLKTHVNDKRFVCDVCNKGFVQKTNLLSHRRTHTGEKPFTCKACGKSFSRSQALKFHVMKTKACQS